MRTQAVGCSLTTRNRWKGSESDYNESQFVAFRSLRRHFFFLCVRRSRLSASFKGNVEAWFSADILSGDGSSCCRGRVLTLVWAHSVSSKELVVANFPLKRLQKLILHPFFESPQCRVVKTSRCENFSRYWGRFLPWVCVDSVSSRESALPKHQFKYLQNFTLYQFLDLLNAVLSKLHGWKIPLVDETVSSLGFLWIRWIFRESLVRNFDMSVCRISFCTKL